MIVVSEQICSAQVRDSEAVPASGAKKKLRSPTYWPATSCRRLRPFSVVRRWKNWIWKRWNWPCGNRFCNWREPPSNSVSMPTPTMSEARELVVAVGSQLDLPGAASNRCRVSSVLYVWSAPTITAPAAVTAFVLAISTWA